MSRPYITFAHNFTPNRLAGLVELSNTTAREPLIESSFSQNSTVMQYEQPGLLQSMFTDGVFNSSVWELTGTAASTTIPISGVILTVPGDSIRTDAYEYIYPGCKFRLYILASTITSQEAANEVVCTITTSAGEAVGTTFRNSDGEWVYMPTGATTTSRVKLFKFDFVVPQQRPVINISLSSVAPLTIIHNAYLVNLDVLYSNRQVSDAPAFYQYQALWNHAPLTGTPPALVGPSGEIIPSTEYAIEYSQLPYEHYPRYHLIRSWAESVGTTECTIRLVLSDRLLASYGEKPLYLQYNKTLEGQTHIGFREMVDPVALEPLPWEITHARLLDYTGLRNGWSGYYLRTIRPKINFVFKPVLEQVSGAYVYPHSLTSVYYSTPEHRQQPTYRLSQYTKVSWELPQLLDNVTMNLDDGIVINRRAYPDNSIVILRDKDPVDGTRYPSGWGWRAGSSDYGTILVSVDDRGLASESIIGIDSKHGLVVCGENLDNKDLWVSYLRDQSWWTFDRPTIFGPSATTPAPKVQLSLLPTWSYVATWVDGDVHYYLDNLSSDVVYIPTERVARSYPEATYPLADILNTIGVQLLIWGWTSPLVVSPDSIELTNYDPATYTETTGSDFIKLSFAYSKGVAASLAAHADRRVALTTAAHENYKLLYSADNGTTWYSARQPVTGEVEPTVYDVTYNPYPMDADCLYTLNATTVGTYQAPAETTADYKATQIAVSGGGLLPDQYYKPGQLARLYPFYNHFADIGRWYQLQYQADSTMVAAIRTDWLYYMSNQLDRNLRPVTMVGDTYKQLSSWVLHGVTPANSNSYVLYWTLDMGLGGPEVTLYKESAHTTIVGYGYCATTTGKITFSDTGSGITGEVWVSYTTSDTDSSNILTVPEDTVKDYVTNLISTTLNKYCSYGSFVDTTTVPFFRFLPSTGHYEAIASSATLESNNSYIILDSLITDESFGGVNEAFTPGT